MVLSLIQKDKEGAQSKKKERPRKPDMRSPLEMQKDKKGKSKYNQAFDRRQKYEDLEGRSSETARALEAFKATDDYSALSPIERSLEENRKQREYLLREYRPEATYEPEPYDVYPSDPYTDKKERKRLRKETKKARKDAKKAHKYGYEMPPDLGEDYYGDRPYESRPLDEEADFGQYYDEEAGVNDEPIVPRGEWVQDPISMGDHAQPKSWEDFDAKFHHRGPLSPTEEREMELEEAKQEYFEELKRESEYRKKQEQEEKNAEVEDPSEADLALERKKKMLETPEEWEDLTPAQRQKKENARHFEELQERKRELEGDNYKLPVPVKPERMEYKPSGGAEEPEMKGADGHYDFSKPDDTDGPSKDDTKSPDKPSETPSETPLKEASQPKAPNAPKENTLCPDCASSEDESSKEKEEDEGANDLNPYEKALKDNENSKKRFVDELKRETEERKQREKEKKEQAERDAKEHREWLEKIYADTGEMPTELAEIYEAEEAKRLEEEAKKRPEPPTPKSMRERVAEESKRRKDAHMAKLRKQDEEEKAEKQRKRDEETARRRLEDPNYEPPPPLTVPKGRPEPPADYKYPKKAREHGFGPPPMTPEEEKKHMDMEKALKKKRDAEKAAKEAKESEDGDSGKHEQPANEGEQEEEEPPTKHHHPQPETKRPDPPSPDKKKAKKPKRKKRKQPKKATKEEPEVPKQKKLPQPEISREPHEEPPKESKPVKKSKKQKKEPESLRDLSPEPVQEKKSKRSKDKAPEKKQKSKRKRERSPLPSLSSESFYSASSSGTGPQESEQERRHFELGHQDPHLHSLPRDEPIVEDPIFSEEPLAEQEPIGSLGELDFGSDDPVYGEGHDEQGLSLEAAAGEEAVESEQLSWPEQSDYGYQEPLLRHRHDEEHSPPAFHHPTHTEPFHQHQHLQPHIPEYPRQFSDSDHHAPRHSQGHEPEPKRQPIHFSTKRHPVEADQAQAPAIYEHKFFELDKKTGKERGRLTEHEEDSSDFGESFDSYKRYLDAQRSHEERRDRRRTQRHDKYYQDSDLKRGYRSDEDLENRYLDWPQKPLYQQSEQPTQRHRQTHKRAAYDDSHKALQPWSDEQSSLDWFEHEYEGKRRGGRHTNPRRADRDYYQAPTSRHEPKRTQRYSDDSDDLRYPSRAHERDTRQFRDPEDLHMADLDLFKQSYDYRGDVEDRDYHEGHRSSRQPRTRKRYDSDSDDYYYRRPKQQHRYDDYRYTEETRQPRRKRHRSYSDDYRPQQQHYEREEQPSHKPRQRRPRSQSPNPQKKAMHHKLTPRQPSPAATPAATPQKPAQQYVIPSAHQKEESSSDSAEESSSAGADKQPKAQEKGPVPVMRRHGEPLMVMPDWQKAEANLVPSSDEEEFTTESEMRFFEAEQSHMPSQRLHSQILESNPLSDDLAHAAIGTFAQVMQPPVPHHVEQKEVTRGYERQVLKLLEEDANKIKMPKFHWTTDGGILRKDLQQYHGEVESSSSNNSSSSGDKSSSSQSSSSSSSSSEQNSVDSNQQGAPTKKRTKRKQPVTKKRSTRKDQDRPHKTQKSTRRPKRTQPKKTQPKRSQPKLSSRQHRYHEDRDRHYYEKEVDEVVSDGDFDKFSDFSDAEVDEQPPHQLYEIDDGEYDEEYGSQTGDSQAEASQDGASLESAEVTYESEEIVDAFEHAMEMLRHHSHGFNLEADADQIANTMPSEVLQAKEKLKNGQFLDKQKLVEDWEPHAIQPKEPLTETDQFSDYWFQSGNFDAKSKQKSLRVPQTAPDQKVTGPLSLENLLAEHEALIEQQSQKLHRATNLDEVDFYWMDRPASLEELRQSQQPYRDHRREMSPIYEAYNESVSSASGDLYNYEPQFVDEPYQKHSYWNDLMPEENGKKKKGHPSEPKSAQMREEMDYLAHQRQLKDRSMRRKRQQKKHPQIPHIPKHPVPPIETPVKDRVDPITHKPLEEGKEFDMMAYMKKQRLAKEREMLDRERSDPSYKPLRPTAHKPAAVPSKDKKKMQDAEEKKRKKGGKKKGKKGEPEVEKPASDKTLFDQINREKMLREMSKRQADPQYEPLSPTAKGPPKNPKKKHPEEPEEDSMFQQMKKRRLEHEQRLIEEDARRAKEDPNYKPKFKPLADDGGEEEAIPDVNDNLKRRLAEERRKHRLEKEEAFEDELVYDDDEGATDDYYSYGDYDSEEDGLSGYDDKGYSANLDYYYDADGFAHPVKPKDTFGYGRYTDAYNYQANESEDFEEAQDLSSVSSASSLSSSEGYSSETSSLLGSSSFSSDQDEPLPPTHRKPLSKKQGSHRHPHEETSRHQPVNRRHQRGNRQHEPPVHRSGKRYRQNDLEQAETEQPTVLLYLQEQADPLETVLKEPREGKSKKAKASKVPSEAAFVDQEDDSMDELLKEVQRELHIRFKNMFEGDMLLPNLEFNPEFEGTDGPAEQPAVQPDKSETPHTAKKDQPAKSRSNSTTKTLLNSDFMLMQLAQENSSESNALTPNEANWLHSRSMWIPRSHRRRTSRPSGNDEANDFDDLDYEEAQYYRYYQNLVDEELARRELVRELPTYLQ